MEGPRPTTHPQTGTMLWGDLLEANNRVAKCYVVVYLRPTMELLSPLVVMLEGLGFNLCDAPFLNVCVPNLPQGVRSGECWRWSELGWRCQTRVGWRGLSQDCSEDES